MALLENGYSVRGTVENVESEKIVGFLCKTIWMNCKTIKAPFKNLQIVEADLKNPNGWEK